MSENANVSLNLQNVPSIFEISACETLDGLIHPALNRLLKHFEVHIFGKFRFREEVSSFVTWILQYTYLTKRGASFGECFYGFQRTQLASGVGLTPGKQFISATLLALIPYVEGKLKDRSANHETSSVFEHIALRMVHAYNTIRSINLILYLIRQSSSHTPIFRALGMVLRHPTESPAQRNSDIFVRLLEILAFFLQFTQWWYNDNKRRKYAGTLPHPKAYHNPNEIVPIEPGKCPICLMDLQTPTVCAMSGYVFCFKCIAIHFKKHQTCPVTGNPANIKDLIRIYESG